MVSDHRPKSSLVSVSDPSLPAMSSARHRQLKGEQSALSRAMKSALEKRNTRSLRRQLTLSSCPPSHDFSSNDFLSLSHSPIFRSRYLQYLNAFPSPPLPLESLPSRMPIFFESSTTAISSLKSSSLPSDHPQGLASTGSRLLDGNSTFALSLESQIARFHHAPHALLFNSGYDANLAVFSTIPQKDDVVLYDELVHASAHDGMRLSRAAECIPFPHNSVAGLRHVLGDLVTREKGIKDGSKSVFVAVESVYSMEGDIAPLRGFVEVLEEVLGTGHAHGKRSHNGYLVVDEAHATGVYGPKGRGVAVAQNVHDNCLIRVHTFGKALAAHGAAVLCDFQTRDYLINYARSLIYTTALPFFNLAAVRTAYELLESEFCDERRDNLSRLIEYTHRALFSLGSNANDDFDKMSMETATTISISTLAQSYSIEASTLPEFAAANHKQLICSHIRSYPISPHSPDRSLTPLSGPSPPAPKPQTTDPSSTNRQIALQHSATSPIFSLLTPQAVELATYCQAQGLNVRAVRPPTVPRGTERVRLCLHAGNTVEAVGQFAAAVALWVAGDDLKEGKADACENNQVSREESQRKTRSGDKPIARL